MEGKYGHASFLLQISLLLALYVPKNFSISQFLQSRKKFNVEANEGTSFIFQADVTLGRLMILGHANQTVLALLIVKNTSRLFESVDSASDSVNVYAI